MKQRLNAYAASPGAYKAVVGVETFIQNSGLEKSLVELVKMRASQINGCAYCLDMHSKDARRNGETEQRLYLLNAWAESPVYTDRERAALAWTDALTLVAETRAPDDVYAAVRAQFKDEELANLTVLIGLINLWNRLAIGFRNVHPVGDSAEVPKARRAGLTMKRVAILAAAAALALLPAPAHAHGDETVAQAFLHPLPSLPGKVIHAVEVTYPPGGKSVPHRHASSAFIVAYVLSGQIRSQVEGEPAKVYQPGQSWTEQPGAHHVVSENASKSKPAKLLAIFVMNQGEALTTPD